MKRGTMQHPKFRRLKRRLGVPTYAAAGVLEGVWAFAAEFAEDGDLSRFVPQDIADHVEWTGDAVELVEALVAERWLDRRGKRLSIHDWEDHLPEYLRERARKRKKRNYLRDDVEESVEELSADIPGHSADSPVPVLSGLVQPNLGKSSPVVSAAPAARPRATDTGTVASMLREANDIRGHALGNTARLSGDEERRLRGYAAECAKEGRVPAFLAQWRGFHGDAYWRERSCPVAAFLREPSKYGAQISGRARPEHEDDTEVFA